MLRFGPPPPEEPRVPGWVRSVGQATQTIIIAVILSTAAMVFQGLKDVEKMSTRIDGLSIRWNDCVELVKNHTFRITDLENRQERTEALLEQLLKK